jgi:predicted AAA+ superfamily ATPase
MRAAADYLPRRATEQVLTALEDTRVVVVNGARQTGKSTLAELALAKVDGGRARFLDDPATRSAAQSDPVRFVRHDGTLLIDEVQRVPDLWLAIKNEVDRDPRPGRFLLTRSARLLGLASLPDALPGRSETIELWPLSQGEIDGGPDGFVDAVFERGAEIPPPAGELRRRDYLARAVRGGYPESVRREQPRRRSRFFENYVADLLARDVKQVAQIERSSDMRRLLSLLAAQTAGLVNYSRLAGDLAITAPTVRNYIEILETIYLVRLVPAWSANLTTRTVATPKVTFVDSGLAAYLASGTTSDAAVGGLVENLVLGELARQLTWSDVSARLFHYRDRDQVEVDALLEDNAGNVVGIEVKAAETARAEDFAGLRHLQRRLGSRFRAGILLYCGTETLPFGQDLACAPISALWSTHANQHSVTD